ncbi:hypothetical protein GCM10027294_53980 [Marinactinospora endophytica]
MNPPGLTRVTKDTAPRRFPQKVDTRNWSGGPVSGCSTGDGACRARQAHTEASQRRARARWQERGTEAVTHPALTQE